MTQPVPKWQLTVDTLVDNRWPNLEKDVRTLAERNILGSVDEISDILDKIDYWLGQWKFGYDRDVKTFGIKEVVDDLLPKLSKQLSSTDDSLPKLLEPFKDAFSEELRIVEASTAVSSAELVAFQQLVFAIDFTHAALSGTPLPYEPDDLPDLVFNLGQAIGIANDTIESFIYKKYKPGELEVPALKIRDDFVHLMEAHRLMEMLLTVRNNVQWMEHEIYKCSQFLLRLISQALDAKAPAAKKKRKKRA